MSNVNDQKILKLKEQINFKKEKLGKSIKFIPITNSSIEIDNERYNIQTLTKNQLITLLVKLNSYLLSAKDLGLVKEYMISGFSVEDWISDIRSKIEIISHKEEEKQLKLMEDKLLKLLSDGKKVELEIDEIESLLNK